MDLFNIAYLIYSVKYVFICHICYIPFLYFDIQFTKPIYSLNIQFRSESFSCILFHSTEASGLSLMPLLTQVQLLHYSFAFSLILLVSRSHIYISLFSICWELYRSHNYWCILSCILSPNSNFSLLSLFCFYLLGTTFYLFSSLPFICTRSR